MAAPNPQVVERQMYVDLKLNGIDNPDLTLAELRDMTGGGVNAHKAEVVPFSNASDKRWESKKIYTSPESIDDAPGLQAFIDSVGADTAVLLKGFFTLNSPITISSNKVHVELAVGTVIAPSSPTNDAIVVTGDDVTLEGGQIVAPAVWDGANNAWTYALVRVTGTRFTAQNVTITNVPKVGFGIRGSDAKIIGCRVNGNYPAAQYTGVETAHYGLTFDPPGDTIDGSCVVIGSTFQNCVQGISIGNFGVGIGYGYVISGNAFIGCHNHGIYQSHGRGGTINGNTFRRCQIPVVIAGQGHSVCGNAMYTEGTGTTLDWAGISVRDAVDCVISGNTIIGDATPNNVGIALDSLNSNAIRRSIVSGNVVILAGNASANAGIRLGNSATEILEDCQVSDNIVKGPGAPSAGVLQVNMKAAFFGYGNTVTDNTVIVTGNAHGIVATRQRGCKIINNTIRNEIVTDVGVTSIHVYLIDTDISVVKDNISVNPSGFGSLTTVHAVRTDSLSTQNVMGPNYTAFEAGLAGSSPYIDGGSGNINVAAVGTQSAAPTTGTWKVGTYILNSAPAVGAPKGWVCTVAGTPGTWVSLGNL